MKQMATKITIKPNGSIRIEGDLELYDGNGQQFDLAGRSAISLCRCGHSKDMPFCDKSHRECGFQSVVTARVLHPPQA